MPAKKTRLDLVPRFRFNGGHNAAFGPGKADLLEHLEKTGSITEAAQAMGMSYMRAWTLVKSLERGFKEPLVRKVRGGSTGGGAALTDTGREVLRLYRQLEAVTARAIQPTARRLAALLK